MPLRILNRTDGENIHYPVTNQVLVGLYIIKRGECCMPFKSEKIKLPKQYDRRIKLTDEQREEIKEKYASGVYSQRALALEYHVSRRLISFIIDPEKYEISKEQYRERRKDGRYKPDRESWNETQRKHREYKNRLYAEGKIG